MKQKILKNLIKQVILEVNKKRKRKKRKFLKIMEIKMMKSRILNPTGLKLSEL